MTFSAVIRFTGAVITALSIAVATYGPASSVLAFSVGAAAAYGLMLLTGVSCAGEICRTLGPGCNRFLGVLHRFA